MTKLIKPTKSPKIATQRDEPVVIASPMARLMTMLYDGMLILAMLFLVGLLSHFRSEQPPAMDLKSFLSENWSVFQLRSWDPTTGALELDYPLPFSLEQMEKYGRRLQELRELPEGNRSTVTDLKIALREFSSDTVQSVTVYGLTTDGKVAYTLAPDGSLTVCWESP